MSEGAMTGALITGVGGLGSAGAARIEAGGVLEAPAVWAHRPVRLGRMDRLCALALLAADAALVDARVAPAAWRGERVGILVGSAYGCHAVNEEFYRGLRAEGVRGASPRAFAYTLPSSPAGELSIHYGACGPCETLVSGSHAGLEAVARAAALCALGRADLVIVVAVEVGGGTLTALGLETRDEAAALVVERREAAERRQAPTRALILGSGSSYRAGAPAQAAEAAAWQALGGRAISETVARQDLAPSDSAVPALARLVALCPQTPPDPVSSLMLLTASDVAGGAAALAVARAPLQAS